jgi:hypothetical protein
MKSCNACNYGNSDNAKFCQQCGTDIENIAPILNAAGGGVAPDYTRMGGALVFFIVWDLLSIAGAVFTLLQLPFVFMNGISLSSIEAVLSSVLPAIPLLISIIFRFKKKSSFLLWFQISLIINLLAGVYLIGVSSYTDNILTMFAPLYSAIGYDIMDFANIIKIVSIVIGAISTGVPFFLITLYYCKSKRVNAYMGSDEYKQKALVKFK